MRADVRTWIDKVNDETEWEVYGNMNLTAENKWSGSKVEFKNHYEFVKWAEKELEYE